MRDEEADAFGATLAGGPSTIPAPRLDVSEAPLEEGDDERYELREVLGEGGMGEVRLCRDRRLGREVALKVIRATGAQRPDLRARFEREARVQGQLEHPSIVPIYDIGLDAHGAAYFTMRRVRGLTLEQVLEARRKGSAAAQSFSPARLLGAFASVCQAVAFAHARGLVHRDLKPANIMLGDFGEVYLLDWGLAKVVGAPETAGGAEGASVHGSGATRAGDAMGTPGYMAPEQVRGERNVTSRADVFALGCVLYECLTAQPAFAGEHVMAVLASLLFEEPARVRTLCPDASEALDELIASMLQKEATARPEHGAAVVRALAELEGSSPSGARRTSVRPRGAALTSDEQRVLTVLLAGRTNATAETVDSHTGSTLRHTSEAVALEHGCRFDVLAGEAILVTARAAGASTDRAAAVARSALALRDLHGDAPLVIVTGKAVTKERMPLGRLLDHAAWLLKQTAPGEVRIDETTAGLIDTAFDVHRADGAIVLRAEREAAASRTLLGRASPFVGRERDLATLNTVFDGCETEPCSQAVLVIAPAGTGKSRLRHEFVRRLGERDGAVEVLHGRGDQLSAGAPFMLLSRALRRAAGIVDGEPVDARENKLRTRLATVLSGDAWDRTVESLSEMIGSRPAADNAGGDGAHADAAALGDAMRAAWITWLRAECEARPVVLVLDDLHWGDLPTVSFVDAALRDLSELPLMVLALARPEVEELFPKLWSQREVHRLHLAPLARKASERLVRECLGADVDAQTLASVVERAEGNAFFLEELIRAVSEGGKDRALPVTVLGMLQSRLDAFEPDARRLLRAASVFGRTFWRGGVAALAGNSAGGSDLDEWLVRLEGREVISRRPGASFPGETEFQFRHDLVREAAYAMLTDEDRVLGHRLAGVWLDAVGETNAIALAEHFDRGGERARAVAHYLRGARQALEGTDLDAVLARAQRGIDCGASGETLGALQLVRAEAFRWRGNFDDGEASATAAAELLTEGTSAWFRAVGEIVFFAARRQRFDVLVEWALRAGASAAPREAQGAQVFCLCDGAKQCLNAGHVREGDSLIARVDQLVGDLHTLKPAVAAQVHRLRGSRARLEGDAGNALAHYESALASLEQAGDVRERCNGEVGLAFSCIETGEFDRARTLLETTLATAGRIGLPAVAARCNHNLGLVYSASGEHERARVAETIAVNAGRAQGDRRFEGWSRIYLSVIEHRAGRFGEAEVQAREASRLLEPLPAVRAGARAALARALLSQGRLNEALDAAREAHDLLESLGYLEEFNAVIPLVLAEVLAARGEGDAARATIGVAHEKLLARAARIDDAARREAFLRRVPEHAATAELAARL